MQVFQLFKPCILFSLFAFQQTEDSGGRFPRFSPPLCCIPPLLLQKLFPTNEIEDAFVTSGGGKSEAAAPPPASPRSTHTRFIGSFISSAVHARDMGTWRQRFLF